jgi:hypothetical protein
MSGAVEIIRTREARGPGGRKARVREISEGLMPKDSENAGEGEKAGETVVAAALRTHSVKEQLMS